jgi:hypothetical protein
MASTVIAVHYEFDPVDRLAPTLLPTRRRELRGCGSSGAVEWIMAISYQCTVEASAKKG